MKVVKKLSQRKAALISWLIIISINFVQLLYVKFSIVGRYDWVDVFYYPFTSLTMGALLIYFWLLPLFKKIRSLRFGFQIPLFVIHGLLYASMYIVLIFFQVTLWSESKDLSSFVISVHKFFYTDFHNIAKNYFFLLAIYISVEYINKREETLMLQRELEDQLKEVKLQALESKLHPHFLFNALNGIAALVNENPAKAEQAIVELSDLLRFALEGNLQKPISMQEELELLNKYISIEKMRYEEQLEVHITIEEQVDMKTPIMPPMILQPILENAIIHGFKYIQHPLQVFIHIRKGTIEISNNGAVLDMNRPFGTGLRIVEQRLNYHFQNQVKLHLYQDKDRVVCEIKGLNL